MSDECPFLCAGTVFILHTGLEGAGKGCGEQLLWKARDLRAKDLCNRHSVHGGKAPSSTRLLSRLICMCSVLQPPPASELCVRPHGSAPEHLAFRSLLLFPTAQ